METFLRDHGHRAAFGASILALALYLLLGMPAPVEGIDETPAVSRAEFRAPVAENASAGVRARWDAVLKARSVETNWQGGSFFTLFVGVPVSPVKEVPKPPVVLPAVSASLTAANPHRITLEWEVLPAAKEDKVVPAKIDGFRVEREAAGVRRAVATLGAEARRFTDEEVEPKSGYVYHLVALTSEGERPVEFGLHATTPDLFRIEYRYAGDGAAWVTIHKTERWGTASLSHLHKAGERIGWWAEPGSKKPVPLHFTDREMDFNTGLTLESVRQVRTTVEVTRCGKERRGNGVVCVKAVDRAPVTVSEFVVKGAEGACTIQEPPLKPRDERCAGCR